MLTQVEGPEFSPALDFAGNDRKLPRRAAAVDVFAVRRAWQSSVEAVSLEVY
jgi:hypothetical protein